MSSVNVEFKVTGGDLSSYMERMGQKANQTSNGMIENAKKESEVAKDQLRSYTQQVAMLERKQRLEADSARAAAKTTRSTSIDEIRSNIAREYEELDRQAKAKTIKPKDYAKRYTDLDKAEVTQTQSVEEGYRDELKRVKEQENDNRVIIRTLRDNIDAIRSSSQQQLGQMRKGDESLVDAVEEGAEPTARLANQLASEQYKEELNKSKKEEERGERDQSGVFGGFLKALAIDRVGGMVSAMPQARSELDFARPMMATMGMALGGLAGNLIDALNVKVLGSGLGNTNFGALGTQFGEKIGEFAGSAIERSYKSREELTSSSYRLQALTGTSLGIDATKLDEAGGTGLSSVAKDLSEYGADFKEVTEMQLRLVTAQASGKNLKGGVENVLAAQMGLGISPDTFMSLTELLRTSSRENRDVLRLIGGVATAGQGNIFKGDRAFLSEFLQRNFTSLQRTLLQTQNTVASGTTFDILKRFDTVGGPFAARDPRSMGLINTVQNSLVNPGADNLRALSMMALRQQNPGMDFHDLLKEQQKGIASPGYLKSMISFVESMGGTEGMKKQNFAGLLNMQGNLAASDLLYSRRKDLMSGKVSTEELLPGEGYGEVALRTKGKSQTSVYAQSIAEIENAYIQDATKGITLMGSKMTELFSKMIEGVTKHIDKELRGLLHQTTAPEPVRKNQTVRPMVYGSRQSIQ